MNPRATFSVKEVADILGISEWLVREECARQNLHSVRIGRRILIPRWAVEERLGAPITGVHPPDLPHTQP